jgi:hypothetical protein
MGEVQVLNSLAVPWGAGLVLIAAGAVLMLFGSRWRDFTEALCASLVGGAVALLLMPPLGWVNPLWGTVGACLAVGVLTVFFRRIALLLLAAIVVGLSLSMAAHLVAGRPTMTLLVRSLSSDQVGTVVYVPDYAGSQLMLLLLVGGMLLGIILTIASTVWARRVTMALCGSLAFLGGVARVTAEFFAAQLPPGYPMKYAQVGAVVWLELAAISVLMQRMADRRQRGEARRAEPTGGIEP